MKNKLVNILVVILVFAMLGTALLIGFAPEFDLKDMLLNMTEGPRNAFRFLWDRPEREEEQEQETEESTEPTKVETPLVLFDEEETIGSTVPIIIIDADGLNELPMDELDNGNS